jgi:ribosome recycling factor
MHKIIQDAEVRMQKAIEAFKQAMSKVRTGRANPSLLEHIRVDYYGNMVPLSQVSNITVADARTLAISPWEKKMTPTIEKAIMTSDLGLNPVTSGDIIRRDANTSIKELLKNNEIAEDEERRLNDATQKITDKFTAEVDVLLSAKEKDLMAI